MGPKGALAAQVGSGPDIIMGWNDDPFVYPDKLVDMTDLVENMGRAHGGWYDNARSYCYDQDVKRWVSLPVGCTGNAVNYRKSWVKEAGFNEFPKDLDGMLKLARVLEEERPSAGLFARPRGRRREQLDALDPVGVRRQAGQPRQLDRDQLRPKRSTRSTTRASCRRRSSTASPAGTTPSNNKAFAGGQHRHDDERHQHLVQRQAKIRPTSSPTSRT